MDFIPVRAVSYGPSRTKLRARGIMTALKANLVRAVTQVCQVVAVHRISNTRTDQEATQQIAARRRQLEMKTLQHPEVSFCVFLC